MSTSGTATFDNQDRRDGQWNETVGSVKLAVGNLVGNAALKREGLHQQEEGQGQKAAGQVKDFTAGTRDRIVGDVGSGIAGMVGNKEAQGMLQSEVLLVCCWS